MVLCNMIYTNYKNTFITDGGLIEPLKWTALLQSQKGGITNCMAL